MIIHSPESEYAKERIKWEAFPSEMGPGKKPYVFRPYPMMMHRAGPPPSGAGAITVIDTEQAGDAEAAARLKTRGFRDTPLDAIAAYAAQALEEAKLAAEIEYEIKHRLSPKAVTEVRMAQEDVAGHMPMVPETPIKRRGRPRKVAVAEVAAVAAEE